MEDYQGILVKFTQKMGRGGVKSPQIKTISNSFVHALTCMSTSLKSKSNKKKNQQHPRNGNFGKILEISKNRKNVHYEVKYQYFEVYIFSSLF